MQTEPGKSKKVVNADEWRDICRDMIKVPPVRPGRGSVLVARQPREAVTSGGIVLPDRAQEQQQIGMVIVLGLPSRNLMGSENEFWLKPGDTVIINQYAGKPLLLRGLELAIFNEDDVMARVNQSD